MRRRRVAALAAHQDAARLDAGAELHHRHEAVAAFAVEAFGRLFRRHAIGGQRAPVGRRIRHRQAGLAVIERLHQVARQALETVDLAPRRLPGAEVGRQFIRCPRQPFEPLARRQRRLDIVEHQYFPLLGRGAIDGRQVLGPVDGQRRGRGRERIAQVPAAQRGYLGRQRRLERVVGGQRVVRREQRRQQRLERGQLGVVGSGDQAVHRKIFFVFHHPHGMDAARVFRIHRHIGRVVAGLGTVGTGCGVRPVVGVVDPAAVRVEQRDGFLDFMQPAPLGGGIAAVDRMSEIDGRIAARDEIAVEVGDVAVGIRVHGVVRRVGAQGHRLVKFPVVARLGADERLRERFQRFIHEPHGNPLAVFGAHDRAVVAVVRLDGPGRHAGGGLVRQRDVHRLQGPLLVAVLVVILAVLFADGFQVLVDDVAAARRVHPAYAVVKTLVHEELAPGHGAVGVKALLAMHLHLGPEVERRVRIDHQQRVAVFGDGRRDGKAVRAARFVVEVAARGLVGHQHRRHPRVGAVRVQVFQLLEVDGFDVAADAALAEGQRHPRLEPRDQVGLDLRMRGQVIVQAIGKRHHQLLEPRRALPVLGLQEFGIDEQLHAQVAVQLGLAFHFRQAAHGIDVVALDAAEIILGLRIHQAEDGVGVVRRPPRAPGPGPTAPPLLH
uniref:Uncharacterized protein n=1 Tax=Tanacetum cinerariifolium TaxID=118510 RepID=A0A699GE36_TANCI|nr:hypothetical protein [Tanacetum cinerariifolium]